MILDGVVHVSEKCKQIYYNSLLRSKILFLIYTVPLPIIGEAMMWTKTVCLVNNFFGIE